MTLYQNYRPKDFTDVVGQEFIKTSLANMLATGRTANVYLFHGVHGTGKTSLARIFAKSLNCTNLKKDGNPCHTCDNCVSFSEGKMTDVIEIDAASNTGVDNVRDLIEKAKFQPNQGSYKIYIIDEAHMLSKGAFNAFLKTLEEPPAHVKFILATTEVDKIPSTIISRSVQYDFQKISNTDVAGRLEHITKTEGITSEKEALDIIARVAKGSMRDAISLLEQYIIDGKITTDYVSKYLQVVDIAFLDSFFGALIKKDAEALGMLAQLEKNSIHMKRFFEECLLYLRDKMQGNLNSTHFSWYLQAFEAIHTRYTQIRHTPYPFLLVQTLVYELLHSHTDVVAPSTPKPVVEKPATPSPQKTTKKKEVASSDASDVILLDVINYLKQQKTPGSAPLITALKSVEIQQDGSTLVLTVNREFYAKQLQDTKRQDLLQKTLTELYNTHYTLEIHTGGTDITEVANNIFS